MISVKNVFCKHKFEAISKFGLSSIISFMIDYSIFSLLSILGLNIILGNLIARIVSGTCNYLINKRYVFKSNNSFYKSMISYVSLAILIITLNTILLHFLVDKFLINKFIAKIIVEIVLFIGNFIIQKKYIFKRRG